MLRARGVEVGPVQGMLIGVEKQNGVGIRDGTGQELAPNCVGP